MAVTSPFRTEPRYSVAQAARLARTSVPTVQSWLQGVTIPPKDGCASTVASPPCLSFLDLAELIVLTHFRRASGRSVTLGRLRMVRDAARAVLQVSHPFASELLRTNGAPMLRDIETQLAGASRMTTVGLRGVALTPGLLDALDSFDFDEQDEMATRWYPYGKECSIVVDPEVAAGWVSIKGYNIRVESVVQRFDNNWTIDDIAEEFEVDRLTIEGVLRLVGEFHRAA